MNNKIIEKMADDFAEVLDKALKEQREAIVTELEKNLDNDLSNVVTNFVLELENIINHITKAI